MAKKKETQPEELALAPITDADLPDSFTRGEDAGRLAVVREPAHVLEEARNAAVALKHVIESKASKVTFNGKTYLGFEDWQTVGRFYGVTARVVRTEYCEYGGARGFNAVADAITSDGRIVSSAESMCLNDEDNWGTRPRYQWQNGKKVKVEDVPVPLYQLKSMASTRACSKALRNVLSWVVVLAGYQPTPAEEMQEFDDRHESPASDAAALAEEREEPAGDLEERQAMDDIPTFAEVFSGEPEPARFKPRKKASEPASAPASDQRKISAPQAKRLYAIARATGADRQQIEEYLVKDFGVARTDDLAAADYDAACAHYGVTNVPVRK